MWASHPSANIRFLSSYSFPITLNALTSHACHFKIEVCTGCQGVLTPSGNPTLKLLLHHVSYYDHC